MILIQKQPNEMNASVCYVNMNVVSMSFIQYQIPINQGLHYIPFHEIDTNKQMVSKKPLPNETEAG
jgi:hypothetical protein